MTLICLLVVLLNLWLKWRSNLKREVIPELKAMKLKARQLKDFFPDLTHTQLLERLAQEKGFKTYASYSILLRKECADEVRDVPPIFESSER